MAGRIVVDNTVAVEMVADGRGDPTFVSAVPSRTRSVPHGAGRSVSL
ncbi:MULTISPECIES: hypothetical protein [unclassified Dietzia]|nr:MULTISPECIES: hypothetical protein [unclassified Dietzia]QGW26426.1 hypothetical protein GJR88_05206 [Dietzia sp. DQ12-45-1b]